MKNINIPSLSSSCAKELSPISSFEQPGQRTGEMPIYFDYSATTPCDPRVIEAMKPYLDCYFGNPHSRNHPYGWQAEEGVEAARSAVADLIGAQSKDVIFTSGATEANNLALKGVAHFKGKGHLITLMTEHKCILEAARSLEQEGFSVTYLPVEKDGLICMDTLKAAFREDTILVSIAAANGEIGVIQPLEAIGKLCRERRAYFHTDAAQAVGKIPLDVEKMNIDLLSLSGHKIYGPKGIGALYVRRRPRVRLRPLFHGGGQERGLRSGTVPPFLCVGLGHACKLAQSEGLGEEASRLLEMRLWLYETLKSHLPDIYLNGHLDNRLPGHLNISFFGVEGEGLMMALKDLALSSGSACTSASLEPSYVLRALGVTEDLAHTSLRITLGRFTRWQEVHYGANAIVKAVEKLRALSPLWEMHQAGIDLSTIEWIAH